MTASMLQKQFGQLFHLCASNLSKTFAPLQYFTGLKIMFFRFIQNPRNHFLSNKASLGPNLMGRIMLTWFDSDSKILPYIQHISVPFPTTRITFIIFWLTEFVGWLVADHDHQTISWCLNYTFWTTSEWLPLSFGKTDVKVRMLLLKWWKDFSVIKMFSGGGKPTLENDFWSGV